MHSTGPEFSEDSSKTSEQLTPVREFLALFEKNLSDTFGDRDLVDKSSIYRGLSPDIMTKIMSSNPLSVNIPLEYGGRGGHLHENLALLSTAAYESLALALTFAINGALFLQPFAKYGQDSVKANVFRRFMEEQNMGGLMITEPDHGSDALRMQTSYIEKDSKYCIKGTKHWAGLTGKADFWLLTARKRTADNQLQRDIDFFLCDTSQAGQYILVEEYFENLGLYQIPYGRNIIDVQVPLSHRLIPESTGINMMIDLLHKSRLHISGVGLGFIGRMLHEAIGHSRQRNISGANLMEYDQVQARISRIQAGQTLCSAFCVQSSELAAANDDLTPYRLEANVIKTVVSDFMQESAQSLLQLAGAKGYRLDHIAGRSTVDSRPFQIFEGSNDILYHQIAESVIGMMRNEKENNLFVFFRNYFRDPDRVDQLRGIIDISLENPMPQRKLVEFGKLVSRIIAVDSLSRLEEKGFRQDLIQNAIEILKHEISGLMSSYRTMNQSRVVEDYPEGNNWMSYLSFVKEK
ncbi:MAG: acyl-CoA dehydrogenase family protein [Bacteroidales bacterium]